MLFSSCPQKRLLVMAMRATVPNFCSDAFGGGTNVKVLNRFGKRDRRVYFGMDQPAETK